MEKLSLELASVLAEKEKITSELSSIERKREACAREISELESNIEFQEMIEGDLNF